MLFYFTNSFVCPLSHTFPTETSAGEFLQTWIRQSPDLEFGWVKAQSNHATNTVRTTANAQMTAIIHGARPSISLASTRVSWLKHFPTYIQGTDNRSTEVEIIVFFFFEISLFKQWKKLVYDKILVFRCPCKTLWRWETGRSVHVGPVLSPFQLLPGYTVKWMIAAETCKKITWRIPDELQPEESHSGLWRSNPSEHLWNKTYINIRERCCLRGSTKEDKIPGKRRG